MTIRELSLFTTPTHHAAADLRLGDVAYPDSLMNIAWINGDCPHSVPFWQMAGRVEGRDGCKADRRQGGVTSKGLQKYSAPNGTVDLSPVGTDALHRNKALGLAQAKIARSMTRVREGTKPAALNDPVKVTTARLSSSRP